MDDPLQQILSYLDDVQLFSRELTRFILRTLRFHFWRFEERKGVLVTALYRQRGKMAGRLVHSGMAGLAAVGVIIAPVVAQEFPGKSVDPWNIPTSQTVLSASSENAVTTDISEKDYRDKIIEYQVAPGDTVSTIAKKFNISEDTIRWQNNLKSKESIKVDQKLEILPVTGIAHKVTKGDTVHSIAKKYDTDAQPIVNFPFNTFVNDETFELAIGQTIIVPDGVKPAEVLWSPLARTRQVTPDAGTVSGLGNFIWPTQGTITQRFVWYHPGLDIANRGMPAVLAADSGKVIVAGWPDGYGYGNRVMIDHGNGTKTLYAHLSSVGVVVGQGVNRGDIIGKMGSTGRSTGPHLHFEVIRGSTRVNPLSVLK